MKYACLVVAVALGVALFIGSALSGENPAGKCGYYTNSYGNIVPRPCGNWHADTSPPAGSTARCGDGSWSWSQHPYASGTCSHHGGVKSYR
jgi:hypothetical protein